MQILEGMVISTNNLLIRESMHQKYLRMGGNDPANIYQGFRNLEHRKLIRQSGDNYKFTKDGIKWLHRARVNHLQIHRLKWDHKWRVVIFDIPETLKRQRHAFRKRLKQLDFYMLQKSVFVCPFLCDEELGYITTYLEVGDYVNMLMADSIGFSEADIKKYYNL